MSHDIDLTQLSEQELLDLNRRIVARLKQLHQAKRYQELAKFNVGETVCFTPEAGRTIVGVIVRLNHKTATVAARDGLTWRVSPALLSRLLEGEQAVGAENRVVPLSDRSRSKTGR